MIRLPSSRALRRAAAAALLCSVALMAVPSPRASGQAAPPPECAGDDPTGPEAWGPTDVSAVTGNGRLSAGINSHGTLTVLRWPSPSFYDQLKYRTRDRSQPLMGALPNEGAFLGLAWSTKANGTPEWDFAWLREWASRQRYSDDDTDSVVTAYRRRKLGLSVVVQDVVAADMDALARRVKVVRSALSPVRRARLIGFANFSPVVSKSDDSATGDWCDEPADGGVRYEEGPDAIVTEAAGTDSSTGRARSVALAMGFTGGSAGHEAATDAIGTSAYEDASDGVLSGSASALGASDAALATDLVFSSDVARATLNLVAAPKVGRALETLREARETGPGPMRRRKARWWRGWLSSLRLPDAGGRVEMVAKRALITLRQNLDNNLIVTSIATQPPASLDWVGNGAFINEMMARAGLGKLVGRHNVRYAALQATSLSKPPGGETIPQGNWGYGYYTDGTVGGTQSHAIDETGWGIWTLWRHYERTRSLFYLGKVYGAITRAAHYLSDPPTLGGCADPVTGLTCLAPDSESSQPRMSLLGSQAALAGLRAAARAAKVAGHAQNAKKWSDRADELRRAIRSSFYDAECECFTRDPHEGGLALWPAQVTGARSDAAQGQARINRRHLERMLQGDLLTGGREATAILGNLRVPQTARQRRVLREALGWIANRATTRTGSLGDAWTRADSNDPVIALSGQPNLFAQAFFYLAATELYGSTRWRP